MWADTLGSIDFRIMPGSSTSRLGNQAQKIPSRKPAARKAWASKAALTSWDEVAFKIVGKVGTRKWVSSPQGIVLWKLHGSFQNKMELVASNETLWHLRTGLHRADRHWLVIVWEGDGVEERGGG